ncbi:hypothetical protein M9H77_30153 [Catharanthus roseus]|uniref:Uncharacterized protein n=1 Tax=Catharanthus roseus TaxID=4058 RepID=A0ACC0A0C7_CATRO|nr:hypothetical protein M9H77_30153 [Catharanthus roseus]
MKMDENRAKTMKTEVVGKEIAPTADGRVNNANVPHLLLQGPQSSNNLLHKMNQWVSHYDFGFVPLHETYSRLMDHKGWNLLSAEGSVKTFPSQPEPYHGWLGQENSSSFNFEGLKPLKLASLDSSSCALTTRKAITDLKVYHSISSLMPQEINQLKNNSINNNIEFQENSINFIKTKIRQLMEKIKRERNQEEARTDPTSGGITMSTDAQLPTPQIEGTSESPSCKRVIMQEGGRQTTPRGGRHGRLDGRTYQRPNEEFQRNKAWYEDDIGVEEDGYPLGGQKHIGGYFGIVDEEDEEKKQKWGETEKTKLSAPRKCFLMNKMKNESENGEHKVADTKEGDLPLKVGQPTARGRYRSEKEHSNRSLLWTALGERLKRFHGAISGFIKRIDKQARVEFRTVDSTILQPKLSFLLLIMSYIVELNIVRMFTS